MSLLLLLTPLLLLLLLPLESTVLMRSNMLVPKVFGDSTMKPDVTRAVLYNSSVIACAQQKGQPA